MAAFVFPDAPTVGQSANGYTWDGEKWVLPAPGGGLAGAVRYDTAQGLTAPQQSVGRVNIGLQQTTPLAAATDFNTIVTPGTYYTVDASCTNVPANPLGDYWYLEVEIYAPVGQGSVLQRAVALVGDTAWFRTMMSGAWRPWRLVLDTGAQTLTAAQQSQVRANLGVAKKNYVINGAMMVSQENPATAVTASNSYPVDQFMMVNGSGGTMSVAQVASVSPAGSPNRLRFTVTAPDAAVAAGDYAGVMQAIEGLRIADLRSGSAAAKTITIQFGVKAPAGTYSIGLRNGLVNRSRVAEYVIAAGEANIDVVKSVTVALDTTGTWAVDNASGLVVMWALMGGTTYQLAAGAWSGGNLFASPNQFNFMGTNGNVFELFDVSITEGTVAPAFVVPDFAAELLACQRYFYQLEGGAPGSAITVFQAIAATQSFGGIQFPVTMRGSPTITVSAAADFNVVTAAGGSALPCSAITTVGASPTNTRLSAVHTTGLVAGDATIFQAGSSNARMRFSARF